MADPIQGLRVNLQLADVRDKVAALNNLGLDINDINRVRGIADAGVTSNDIKTLSGTDFDLEKEIVSIYQETARYDRVLYDLIDTSTFANQNMFANASIIAASFKFNALSANNSVISSEISTSRESVWSTIGNDLYYGSKVYLDSDISLSELVIDKSISLKRFESEIPTHKLRFNIDDVPYNVYAMKNIPIVFNTYFGAARNVYITVKNARLGGAAPFLRPSWVITEPATGRVQTLQNIISNPTNLTNVSTARNSIVSIVAPAARERKIEFFYPVNFITKLYLPGMKIAAFPSVVMPQVTLVNMDSSDFREMPDFKTYTPILTELSLRSTDLTLSDNVNLRTFGSNVVNRLPTTLQTVDLTGCYSGLSSANLQSFSALTSIKMNVGTGGKKMTGISPAINTSSVQTYEFYNQDFSEIHSSVQTSNTLKTLDFSYNRIPDGQVITFGNAIENIYFSGNFCDFPNVSNKTSLKLYQRTNTNSSSNTAAIFEGCTSLESINISETRASGPIQSFSSNIALKIFNAWNTRQIGADSTYALKVSTFGPLLTGGCRPNLETFSWYSPLVKGIIEENTFNGMYKLVTFSLSSALNGITGSVPTFPQSSNLRTLSLRLNSFTGTMPNFSNNPKLTTLNLSLNKLTGDVPSLSLPFLTRLILNNNLLTGFGGLNLPSLIEFTAFNNNIQRIPDFSTCRLVQTISLNANPISSTNRTTYISGSLALNTSLRTLNLSNCGLKRQFVDEILKDLVLNYSASPRATVTIILTGNESPSQTTEIQEFCIARLQSAGWKIQVS
jgi:hypothetical protein